MTTFSDVKAEAAWAIASNGFAWDEVGTSESSAGWNALVTVTATTLLNIDEADLSERFAKVVPDIAGAMIWIRQTSDGYVRTIESTPDDTRPAAEQMERKWYAYVLEHGNDDDMA